MRSLPEDIVDDLDRGDARIFDRLQGLLDPFDRDAVVTDLALGRDFVERAEKLGPVIDVRRRAVELDEIEGLDAEILEAAVDEGFDIGAGIAIGDMRIESSPALVATNGFSPPRSFSTAAMIFSERPSP